MKLWVVEQSRDGIKWAIFKACWTRGYARELLRYEQTRIRGHVFRIRKYVPEVAQ